MPGSDTYNILSLDGGGVRGAFTARVLDKLEQAAGVELHEAFDLIAGTSSGGILAMGLAAGKRPSELVDIFEGDATRVFAKRDFIDGALGGADELKRADYDNHQGLLAVVKENLGVDTTLDDLQTRVLISSFDLKCETRGYWKPKFFHNFPDPDENPGDELLRDVALRTSAAPTFFPAHQGYVDGGVAANNPSMCALAMALHDAKSRDEELPLSRIRVVSVGSGLNVRSVDGNPDWGTLPWLTRFVDLFIDGMNSVADFQCRALLGDDQYARLNAKLSPPVPIDGVDQLDRLADAVDEIKDEAFQRAVAWIRPPAVT